jgi:hypothetical protein
MIVYSHLVPQFVEFLRLRFGADMRVHDEETRSKIKEFSRGFIGEDFVCLKESEVERTEDSPIVVNVVCSNAILVDKMENDWGIFVSESLQESD